MNRLGDWYIYCDICGQKCLASKSSKLSTYTGRGGLVVCQHDRDDIDPGLIPYRIPVEKNVPYVRIDHTNTDDGAPQVDLETMTYIYYLASSQDNVILMSSQDDAWLIPGIPI
jgi:hypothetical protein